jgi:general stress protein CsbA
MKTTVMALDLAAAGVLTWSLCRRSPLSLAPLAKNAGLFVIGLTMVPGVLLLRFAAKGALGNLYYCLIQHNLIAATERTHAFDLRGIAVLAALAGILWWSQRIIRKEDDRSLAVRRIFILFVGGIYPVILFIFWPLVTREDFLALIPVVGLVVAPALLAVLEKGRQRHPRFAPMGIALPACLVLALLAMDIQIVQPWRDRADFEEGIIASTLKLTDPGDYVMDTKGEMIYRNRPYYYALEEMTRWMLRREQIKDNIPEQMIAHGVCVASRNPERYPARTAKFLKQNFVPVSFRVLVAGKILTPAPAGHPTSFVIAIPAKYALLGATPSGPFLLDGKTYEGPVLLAPGQHSIQTTADGGPVAIVWAQALQRGFSPFYRLSAEEKNENSQSRQDNIF